MPCTRQVGPKSLPVQGHKQHPGTPSLQCPDTNWLPSFGCSKLPHSAAYSRLPYPSQVAHRSLKKRLRPNATSFSTASSTKTVVNM